MNHSSPEFAHLFELPFAERLQLVEDLWDSIAAEPDRLPMPQWQMDELRARASAHDAGQQTVHAWSEVMADARRNACAKSS